MIDYYGTDADYIHLKFGEMRRAYNFTYAFRAKHPNFCAEYEKHWVNDPTCRFKGPLEIAQYIDMYEIPVHLYFNYTDTPVKNMEEVYEYFIREYGGISVDTDGKYRSDYQHGLDGEEEVRRVYSVVDTSKTRFVATTDDGVKNFSKIEDLVKFVGKVGKERV